MFNDKSRFKVCGVYLYSDLYMGNRYSEVDIYTLSFLSSSFNCCCQPCQNYIPQLSRSRGRALVVRVQIRDQFKRHRFCEVYNIVLRHAIDLLTTMKDISDGDTVDSPLHALSSSVQPSGTRALAWKFVVKSEGLVERGFLLCFFVLLT